MKKLQILIALISLLLISVAVFFVIQWRQDQVLESVLRDAISQSETINVQELVAFEWDKMLVFGQYTSESTIDDTLQFEYGKNGALQDGYITVLFTRNGKVIRHAVISQYSGGNYFLKDVQAESFSPSEAVFIKSGDEFIAR
jgi:hypothetical protein